jgi:hypothetical protein
MATHDTPAAPASRRGVLGAVAGAAGLVAAGRTGRAALPPPPAGADAGLLRLC